MTDFDIDGNLAEPETIDLYAMFGSFEIADSPYKICYASTTAKGTGLDGHATLLSELKPMRERLEARELTDIKFLMQRDLNDDRVAHELIPYLLGKTSAKIGFFPAVLAVLVPNGYLKGNADTVHYPRPATSSDKSNITTYEGCWTVERYKIGAEILPLGRIRIVRSKSEIVVLDGQHRSSAFRYLSGDFKPSEDIHQAFYDDVPPPQPLDADLPVTLIWFEAKGDKEVEPILISRRLFVDVNNGAKHVSASRRILLDDRAVVHIGTQELYTAASEAGFNPAKFSLLHSAFDMDSDISDNRPQKLALTTPEIISDALRYALFGTSAYDYLGRTKVDRMMLPRETSRFRVILPKADIPETGGEVESRSEVYFDESEKVDNFRIEFNIRYRPVLLQLFNDLDFLNPHYSACQSVADWIKNTQPAIIREVWDDVFCGGEGLYWSFYAQRRRGVSDVRHYQEAIDAIRNEFSSRRASSFTPPLSVVDNAYTSFTTKAFQIGYVMAVDHIASNGDGDRIVAASDLIGRLNQYNSNNWVAMFDELRPLFFGSAADPKYWPGYRTLLIRMYDGARGLIFDAQSLKISPDWKSYEYLLNQIFDDYTGANDSMPDGKEIEQLAKTQLHRIEAILSRCGLDSVSWFEHDDILRFGVDLLNQKLQAFYTQNA